MIFLRKGTMQHEQAANDRALPNMVKPFCYLKCTFQNAVENLKNAEISGIIIVEREIRKHLSMDA